jgi:hypothetical protein
MLIQTKGADGTPAQVEVEGQVVPGMDGLFAVCRSAPPNAEDGDEDLYPPWSLTHVSTGLSLGWFWKPTDAEYVAAQIYRASPAAWRHTDADEVVAKTPIAVGQWITLLRRASCPPQLLKSCAEFVREFEREGDG